ncbi:MAG TPA: protease inhibitor I42 family protein [Desulfomonilia bacterium]
MKKTGIILIAAAFLFCAEASFAADRTITDSDDWIDVEMNVGDILTVILNDNPDDGYDWTVGRYDDDILERISGPTAIPSNGTAVTRFRVTGTGTTDLLLRYNDTSGAGVSDVMAFQVTVIVRN